MRAHGTYARYKLESCHCEPCREANRAYVAERARRVEPPYVHAGRARRWVTFLGRNGVGLKTVAASSGVSQGALTKLLYGHRTRGQGPTKRIRRSTEQAILAVMPSAAAGGARVNAKPTWRMINKMVRAGVPKLAIAEQLGGGPGLQISRRQVTVRNARKIADIYDRWRAGDLELVRRDSWGHEHPVTPPERRWSPPPADVDIYDQVATVAITRTDRDWRKQSACREHDVNMWFPALGDFEMLNAAKKVCATCPVRDRCLVDELNHPDGVYGGLSTLERRRIIRRRSQDGVAA